MADLITSDHPLNESEQVLLRALLDTLLPASEDGRMPSATEVDFAAYLRTQAADFVPALKAMLAEFDAAFADLPLAGRCECLSDFSAAQPERFHALLLRAYDCYYQDDRVRQQIGVVSGAPFPQGNELAPGDLSLLDPVIENREKHTYRKA